MPLLVLVTSRDAWTRGGIRGPSWQPQEAAPRFLRLDYVCDSDWRVLAYPLSLTIVVSICLGLFLIFLAFFRR